MNSESPETPRQLQPPEDSQDRADNAAASGADASNGAPTGELLQPQAASEPAPSEPQPSEMADRPTTGPTSASKDSAGPMSTRPDTVSPQADSSQPADGAEPTAGATPATDVRRPGRIQVGSRRDKTDETKQGSRPRTAGGSKPIKIATPNVPKQPVPTPSVRRHLSAELQEELDQALGNSSIEELLQVGDGQIPAASLETGSQHHVPVIRIHGDNVFFAIDGRHEGVASRRQFKNPPEIGTVMDVVIKSHNADDGLYEVAVPGESTRVDDWSDLVEGALVDARITGANTGGLECRVGTIRGFIPSSQIAMFRVEDYAQYLDQRMLCVVYEVNPSRKNLVLSRRAVLEREKEEQRKELLESLEVGQVLEGIVQNIRDFGAFVDVGGLDGLVHISQLSWDHVKHPSDVLEVGQKIRVKIEKVDLQTGKIGLSYRDLLEHPWENIEEKFLPETEVTGTVSRIAKFGAFVKLASGIEGLVHISELSHSRVPSVGSVVSEGDQVQVKILSVDAENQRIALSMKAVLPVPEPESEGPASAAEEPDPPRQLTVPRRQEPLRGGTNRESGGDQFGLKW